MHVLDSFEHSMINDEVLVKDVSLMDIFHNVSPNDGVQVGLHEVKYQVDIFVIFRFEDVK